MELFLQSAERQAYKMAYVAVTGGREAVENSIELLSKYRTSGEKDVEIEAIKNRMGLLIDRIMSEAGFYAPDYAALALKQAEGSVEEAVFLLRAYRSTLSRSFYSKVISTENMTICRRISAAFKDIIGGQFLGATYDYTHRLLDFSLLNETVEEVQKIKERWEAGEEEADPIKAPRVSDVLRDEGAISVKKNEEELEDITQNPITFPAPRSARLQTITRGETGYVNGLAYAGIRGFGPSHPTVGELRTGDVEILIEYPLLEEEELYVGSIVATEVESFFSEESKEEAGAKNSDPLRKMESGQGDKADTDTNELKLGIGYGLVFGRNDNKAISMSILDYILCTEGDSILNNQEFVLLHGDCLEMSGFISHLKLPHYVTFQSKLDRVRSTSKKGGKGNE